jgi:hypothetical protein
VIAALAVSTLLAAAPPLAQEWEAPPYEEEADEDHPKRLRLGLWGGEALATGGTGHGSALYGGELAWAFDSLDLGVAGYAYNSLLQSNRPWTPVVLARVTERFRTRRSLEAAFTFGIGAGRPKDWTAWFQVALGVRFDLGPMFLGGEIAFEQYDLLHLTAGVGVKL